MNTEKKIFKREYKMVNASWGYGAFEGGSGLAPKIRKLYYICSCGKKIPASNWNKHKH